MTLSRRGRPPEVVPYGGTFFAVTVKGITYKFREGGFQLRALPLPERGNKEDRDYAKAVVLEYLRQYAATA